MKRYLSRGDRVMAANGCFGTVLTVNGGGRFAQVRWDNGIVSDLPYERAVALLVFS